MQRKLKEMNKYYKKRHENNRTKFLNSPLQDEDEAVQIDFDKF